jgi:hypothetical protein
MIMASVSWDSEELIHVNFVPLNVTIDAQYYSNIVESDPLNCQRRLSYCMEILRKRKLTTVNWEIISYSPESSNVASGEFYGSMKDAPGRTEI